MTDPKRDLQRESEAAAHLRMALADTIEHDDDVLYGLIEGQTDLYETLDRVLDAIHQDEADVAALKARIAQHESRKARLEHRAKRAKAAIQQALSQAGLRNARCSMATISLGKSYRVDIVNSERLPADLLRHRAPEPDKAQISGRLKAGEEVPGAELTETQSVRITWT